MSSRFTLDDLKNIDPFDVPASPGDDYNRVESGVNAFVRGAGNVVSSLPKAVGELTTGIANKVTGGSDSADDSFGYEVGGIIDQYFAENFPTNDRYRGEFAAETFPSSAGSLAGFAASGLVSKALKIPAALGTATIGGAATGVEGVEDYKQTMQEQGLEVDPDKRFSTFAFNVPLGASEAIPLSKAFDRFDKLSGKALTSGLTRWQDRLAVKAAHVSGEGIKGGFEESLQEIFQKLGANYVASGLVEYDPERDLFQGTGEGGAAGFITGLLMNSISTGLGMKYGNGDKSPIVKSILTDAFDQKKKSEETGQPVQPMVDPVLLKPSDKKPNFNYGGRTLKDLISEHVNKISTPPIKGPAQLLAEARAKAANEGKDPLEQARAGAEALAGAMASFRSPVIPNPFNESRGAPTPDPLQQRTADTVFERETAPKTGEFIPANQPSTNTMPVRSFARGMPGAISQDIEGQVERPALTNQNIIYGEGPTVAGLLPSKIRKGLDGMPLVSNRSDGGEQNVRVGRDEKYGIDVTLEKQKDGFLLKTSDDNQEDIKFSSGVGGVYRNGFILNKEGEFVPPAQIVQAGLVKPQDENAPFKGSREELNLAIELAAELEFAKQTGNTELADQLEKELFDLASGRKNENQAKSNLKGEVAKLKAKQGAAERTARKGSQTKAWTPDNKEIDLQFEVVESSSLQKSNDNAGAVNKAYPAELQPRDRTSLQSRAQITEIAGKLNPNRLGDNPEVTNGAPIVDPDTLAVIAGNGRSLALDRAYSMGDKAGYKQWLVNNAAKFGINAEEVAKMKNPVLVRNLMTPMSTIEKVDMAGRANERTTLAMTPTETAQQDAQRITDEVLAEIKDGDLSLQANVPFIRKMAQSFGSTEAAGLMDTKGRANKQMIDRLTAAIVAKAYGSKGLTETVAEGVTEGRKNLVNALVELSSRFARLQRTGRYSAISGHISEAVDMLRDADSRGLSIDEYLAQQDSFTERSEAGQVLAVFFDQFKNSKPAIVEGLESVYSELQAADDYQSSGSDMFGDYTPPTVNQIVKRKLKDEIEAARARGRNGRSDTRGTGEGQPGRSQGRGAENGSNQAGKRSPQAEAGSPEDFGLSIYSEEDIAAKEKAQQDAADAEAARIKQEEDRAKADQARDDFTLTGSNQTADIAAAAGQEDIFSQPETNEEKTGVNEKISAETTLKVVADSWDRLRKQDIDRLMGAALDVSDDHFLDVYLAIKKNRPDYRDYINEILIDFAPFLEDSNNAILKAMAARAEKQHGVTAKRSEILKQYPDIVGAELGQKSGSLYAFILPDASENGKFRITYFSAAGFTGHSTYATKERALDEALREGYNEVARGKLAELSSLDSFKSGNEWAEKIRKVNAGEMKLSDLAGENSRAMFIGEKAKTANAAELEKAKTIKSPSYAWQQTGWTKGPDGKWRFEISDKDASFKRKLEPGERTTIGQVLDHPALFEAYPAVADVELYALLPVEGYYGMYYPSENAIYLHEELGPDQQLSTLLHEIQHWIQEIENWGRGGSHDKRFADYIKSRIKEMVARADMRVSRWQWENSEKLDKAQKTADLYTFAMLFESSEQLIKYSGMDKPSGVLRHIRNNTQWLYSERFQNNPELRAEARELERRWYDLPKSHKMAKRNAFLRDLAFDTAKLLRKAIPVEVLKNFKEDGRQAKSLVGVMQRQATKAHRALAPLNKLRDERRAAERVEEGVKYNSAYDIYHKLAGEVEARNTQTRQKMTDEERRQSYPESTADTRNSDAIVTFNYKEINAPAPHNMASIPEPSTRLEPGKPTKRKSLDVGTVSKIVDGLNAEMPNAEVIAVARERDLPQAIKDWAEENNYMGKGSLVAVYHDGKAYVVAENSRSERQVVKSVLHEVIGHHGIQGVLGDRMDSVLDQIARDYGRDGLATKDGERITDIYGLKWSNPRDRRIAAEEYIAHLAETNSNPGLLDRIIAKVRELLRKIYPSLKWTDADIAGLLAKSRKFVEGGKAGRIGETQAGIAAQLKGDNGPGSPIYEAAKAKGLDMSKAGRMERAKAMGFDIENIAYHATTADFSEFDTSYIGSNYGQDEDGFFFSSDPDVVSTMETPSANRRIDVFLTSNLQKIEVNENPSTWIDRQDKYGLYSEAKDEGFDGLAIKNKKNGEITYVVFNPSNIRSINAAFDPDQADSPDIRAKLSSQPRARIFSQSFHDVSDATIAKPEALEPFHKRAWKTIKEDYLPESWREWRQGVFDQFHSIETLEKDRFGKLLDGKDSAYKAAARTQNLGSVMEVLMHKGTLTYQSGSVEIKNGTQGLMQIFKTVSDQNLLREWETWAAAKRASRLITEGKEKNFNQAQINTVLSEVNAKPAIKAMFEHTQREWIKFNKGVLDFAEQAGLIDPAERAVWEKDDYLPFHRINQLEDEPVKAGKNQKGLTGQRSGVRKLKGGAEKISPLESMVLNTTHMIDAAFKNIAMQRIADLAETSGAMTPLKGMPGLTQAEVQQQLQELGYDTGSMTAEQLGAWNTLIQRHNRQGDGVVMVSIGGKLRAYKVEDALLMRSITSLGHHGVEGIMRLFRGAKRLLTTAVTADPAFMVRNFIRDSLSTAVTVDAKIKPLVDGIRKMSGQDAEELLWRLKAAGAGGGGFYDTSPEEVRSHLSNLKKNGKVIQSAKDAWHFWQKIGAKFENANRLAVADKILKDGGTLAEAAHEAQDVMNFTRRGDYRTIQILTEMVPFMNARIQGLERLWRGAIDNGPNGVQFRKQFWTKGAIITAATLSLLAMNWDNDDYWDLPEWDRDTYYHFFVDGEHYRLPKPFEVGAIFSTIPERMFEQMRDDADMKLFGSRMLHMFQDTFALAQVPQLFKPAYEVAANTNSFTDRPIINYALQNVRPEAQYDPFTSETMRMMADTMPDWAPEWMRSPKKLEHVFTGYFGALGGYVMDMSDFMVRDAMGLPETPTMRGRDMPILKSFYQTGVGSTKQSDLLYKYAEAANTLQGAIKKYRAEGQLETARELEKEGKSKLKVRIAINRAVARMSELNAQIKRVLNSSAPGDLKRAKVDALQLEKQRLAELTVKRYRPYFK